MADPCGVFRAQDERAYPDRRDRTRHPTPGLATRRQEGRRPVPGRTGRRTVVPPGRECERRHRLALVQKTGPMVAREPARDTPTVGPPGGRNRAIYCDAEPAE